jgi:hypothetical protein
MMNRRSVLALILMAVTLHGENRAPDAAHLRIDFDKWPAGSLPEELMVIEGEFRIVDEAGNKRLEMLPAPVVDGAVLIGPSLRGAATVRARIKAEKSRRSFPRFGVALHGISGSKLRVVPAQKLIELLHGEEQIGRAEFEWKEEKWLNVELSLRQNGADWMAEARVWEESTPRPAKPSLTANLPAAPGQGRASVLGSPYANKPIHFDDVEIMAEQ